MGIIISEALIIELIKEITNGELGGAIKVEYLGMVDYHFSRAGVPLFEVRLINSTEIRIIRKEIDLPTLYRIATIYERRYNPKRIYLC